MATVNANMCERHKNGCYAACRHNRYVQTIIFIILLVAHTAELLSDWLLYNDISKIRNGLVYGPLEQSTVTALLVFFVAGVVTYTFELANIAKRIFTETSWIDINTCQALTIWVEEVPQIAINVIIAACREEAISYWQFAKATVVIVSVVLRILVASIIFCYKSRQQHRNLITSSKHWMSLARVMLILGLFLMFCGSVAVFVFTQTEIRRNGDWALNIPTTWEHKYGHIEDRHLQNVRIFVHYPRVMDIGQSAYSKYEENANWIQLVSIKDIISNDTHSTVRIAFDNATKTKFHIWKLNPLDITTEPFGECYTINRNSTEIIRHMPQKCSGMYNLGENYTSVTFKFVYIPAQVHLVLGDITFNAKLKNTVGECHDIGSTFSDSILAKHMQPGKTKYAVIRYFRPDVNTIVKGNPPLVWNPDNRTASFYSWSHLVDTAQIWRTGFLGCDSSGSVAPHLDLNIDVPC